MDLRPPLHVGVVALENGAFGSPSTKVANFTLQIVLEQTRISPKIETYTVLSDFMTPIPISNLDKKSLTRKDMRRKVIFQRVKKSFSLRDFLTTDGFQWIASYPELYQVFLLIYTHPWFEQSNFLHSFPGIVQCVLTIYYITICSTTLSCSLKRPCYLVFNFLFFFNSDFLKSIVDILPSGWWKLGFLGIISWSVFVRKLQIIFRVFISRTHSGLSRYNFSLWSNIGLLHNS